MVDDIARGLTALHCTRQHEQAFILKWIPIDCARLPRRHGAGVTKRTAGRQLLDSLVLCAKKNASPVDTGRLRRMYECIFDVMHPSTVLFLLRPL